MRGQAGDYQKQKGHPLYGARETWLAPNVLPAPVLPPHAPRPTPHASHRWVCFSGSIPPLFVLSPNMPMTNTRAIWLRFGAFLSPPAPSHRIYWPLCFRPTLDASRPTPDQRGQVVRRAPRWLLPDTNRRFVKDRTEPDRDERPLYFSMSPNRAIAADKSIRFFPPRCRTTVDHSLVVGGAGRQWL